MAALSDGDGAPLVMTVRGPVAAESLGPTLVHEHLWSDMTVMLGVSGTTEAASMDCCAVAADARWNPSIAADNYRLTDPDLQADELADAVALGVATFVDATPPALGRDPHRLVALSHAIGAQVVMGCGWYLERTHPDAVARLDIDALADSLIGEITDGVGTSGVRPGIVGEIGTGDPVTAAEAKCVRAAAVAARETGLPLSVHVHPWGTRGTEVVELVAGEGLPLDRLLLNHVSTAVDAPAYLAELLASGANLAFDLFGFDHSLLQPGRYPPSDHDVAVCLARLFAAGHGPQLFASQDVGVRTRLRRYGGWGYGHLLRHVVPLLTRLGVDDEEIDQLLVRNPARLLTFGYRGATRPRYRASGVKTLSFPDREDEG